jgi:hypothetical protein
MTVLLVDVANVVGSRPDGWWRDRAGATTRLLARLAALPGRTVAGPDGRLLACSGVTAVVEGRARAADDPGGVTVVRADGSGDDTVAELAAAGDLLVVTADRGLRARLPDGSPVAGPGWLLALLDEVGA